MNNWKKWSTERLSTRIFYVLVALCIVVFALFGLVGYNRPFDEDPNFNAPLFTDAVLILGYLFVITAIGFAIWSVVRALKMRGKGDAYDNNIPTKHISYIIVGGVAALFVVTFLIGSSSEMIINGVKFTDHFLLKVSDMFIFTSLILMVVAIASVIFGATKYTRKQ